tara:strand:- start:60 stop:455 length:396 start_codon:yes stop_codon:yes gene_type:complete
MCLCTHTNDSEDDYYAEEQFQEDCKQKDAATPGHFLNNLRYDGVTLVFANGWRFSFIYDPNLNSETDDEGRCTTSECAAWTEDADYNRTYLIRPAGGCVFDGLTPNQVAELMARVVAFSPSNAPTNVARYM